MNIVIDANVFKAYYEESVLELPAPRPGRTDSPSSIFARLGADTFSYVDVGQQMESEWRNLCRGGEEWFDGWLSSVYASGGVTPMDINKTKVPENKYREVGFPFKGRDIWYIRVAVSLSSACSTNDAYLISEDIDFFDPKRKKDASREKYIRNGEGAVAKQLKKDGVFVCCICSYLETASKPTASSSPTSSAAA